jgi:Putative amidoligase enzyme
MNVSEMTFGVEIECCIPVGVEIAIGGYHSGEQITGLPAGWNAQRDGSISAPSGFKGVEVVSPVLKGVDGLKQIKAVCEWLRAIGAKVNRSTGLHVHVGWDINHGRDAMKRLAHDVANFETAIYASTGTRSRQDGRYCKPVRDDQAYVNVFKNGDGLPSRIDDRFHVLNVTNLGSYKSTVEFRAFAGTTSQTKIIGYIRLCLGIVERSLVSKRPARWDGVKVNTSRAAYRGLGTGGVELKRLMYALGWIKGDVKHVHGDLQAEGLPTVGDVKKEFFRLAAKYDAADESDEL